MDSQCWKFRSAPNVPTAQRTDSNKLLVTMDPPLAQQASIRPPLTLTMVVTKKQHKFESATEDSVRPPKTNDKNCIGTMYFISFLPSLPLRIPSPPTRRAEKGHAGTLQTFSLWRWGGNGLAVRQNPHSFSLTTLEKDRVCHPAICNRYPISPRRKIASATGYGK
jgi:hypothetical protein